MDSQIITALIGLFGVVIGVLLNEFFFQKQKQSLFSGVIFNKKLKTYSNLLNMFKDACKKTRDAALNPKLSNFDKETIVRNEIINIVKYTDSKPLFVDTNLVLLTIKPLLLVSLKKRTYLKEEQIFSTNQSEVIEEFKNDLGINRINFFFKKLNRKKSISQRIELNSIFKRFRNPQ